MTRRTLADRFWAKVNRMGQDDCWNWTAAKTREGYGHIHTGRLHAEKAHRVSYRLHFGEIPPGMVVMHRCDNPSCVSPPKLEACSVKRADVIDTLTWPELAVAV